MVGVHTFDADHARESAKRMLFSQPAQDMPSTGSMTVVVMAQLLEVVAAAIAVRSASGLGTAVNARVPSITIAGTDMIP
jgi:hypothetical protein